jgi:hypothetical protein
MSRVTLAAMSALVLMALSFGLAIVLYPLVVRTFRLLGTAWLYFNGVGQ